MKIETLADDDGDDGSDAGINKVMDDLKWMQQVIWSDYPMLETNILSSSDALHVWKNKTDTKGLKYLVNFHLIFKVQNDCTIIANLITFNGKTVDSLVFHRSKNEQDHLMVISDHLKVFLNDFSTDHDLCQGVDRNNIQENEEGHLLEFLNDSVIARSMKCRFKLKSNPDELFCEECAKLKLVKVEPVVNITKIEDNTTDADATAAEDIKNVLALTISEPNNEGYESENYRDLENNVDGFDAEDCDDDDWGVTLYKNDEPMKHYGTPNKLKNTTSSDDTTYYPPNNSINTRPKRKKKLLRGSSGTKCRPIIGM